MGANEIDELLAASARMEARRLYKPDETHQSLKLEALNDFYVFTHDVLGYRKIVPELHGVWCEKLQGMIGAERINPFKLLNLAFRGSFKSSVISIALPLHLLAKNPNLRILLVNAVTSNAEAFIREQQAHIRQNQMFRTLFGDWEQPGEFRDNDYIVATRTSVIGKEPSVKAAGLDSTLESGHYDVVICDDLVNMEDKISPIKRKRTLEFYRGLFSMLERTSAMIVVGTRWSREDLYDHIMNTQNAELKREGRPQFIVWNHPAVDENDEPLHPNLLGKEALTELRVNEGIVLYAANYRLDPMPEEDMIFKQFHFFDPDAIHLNGQQIYGYADHSAGKKEEKNDTAAIITALLDTDGSILIVDADIKRRPVSETNNRIVMKQLGLPYYSFGVEDDIYKLIGDDLVKQSKENSAYVNVRRRPVSGLPNKTARINSIEGLVSSGQIKFRKDWKTAPNNYYLLIEQLQEFGNKRSHDDGPDALEGVTWLIRGKGKYHFGILDMHAKKTNGTKPTNGEKEEPIVPHPNMTKDELKKYWEQQHG